MKSTRTEVLTGAVAPFAGTVSTARSWTAGTVTTVAEPLVETYSEPPAHVSPVADAPRSVDWIATGVTSFPCSSTSRKTRSRWPTVT